MKTSCATWTVLGSRAISITTLGPTSPGSRPYVEAPGCSAAKGGRAR
jgi:hypothetical protein